MCRARSSSPAGQDELLSDAEGKAAVSYGHYAVAMVDEIETPKNMRRRFTVAY